MEPPAGGPEDKTPPEIIEVIPAADSTGISRTQKVQVVFSEKIDSESFRQRIIFYPKLVFKKIGVSNNKLEIEFKGLLPETTISFYLKKGYEDNHNIKAEKSNFFYFSTTDSLERGLISGRIFFKKEVMAGGIARLTSIEPDTFKNVYKKPELRTAVADENGDFSFRYLPTDSSGFRLWAFLDTDKNGDYSSSSEFYFLHADTIYLTGRNAVYKNFTLNIIDPNEPGEVRGSIKNKTSIEKLVTVRIKNIVDDKSDYEALADTSGVYSIRQVLPGDYTFSAFIDMNADSLPGSYADPVDSSLTLEEPCVSLPDTINIAPAEIKKIPDLELGNDKDEE
jgi:hypothetical protein